MIAGSRRIFSYFTAAVLALGAPRALAAQDSTAFTNHLYYKWQINVDFTTVLNNSTARFDASDGERGTDLDFRSMLGISGSSIQPALGLSWKPGRRTEFDLGYQFINQSGSRTLTDTLYIGNDSVAGGLHADTKVGASNLTFQFKYALFAGPGHTIGLALGLGRVYLSLELDAEVAGCSGTACADGAVTVSKEFIGPTASLGAYGRWRVGDRWYVGGDARALGANIDRFNISVFEANAGAKYFLSNRFGLGASFYYTDVQVDAEAKEELGLDDLIGTLSYNYTSFRLGVVAAF
jgi:hypothetical protein